jgi:hypothetical protein
MMIEMRGQNLCVTDCVLDMMQSYWCANDDVGYPKALAFQESLTVLGKLLSDSSDIMLGQNISLMDSILLRTFELPCRALGCQCFDFQSYLHVSVGRIPSAYMCPICNQVSNLSKLYAVTLWPVKIAVSDATICLMKNGSFEVKSPASFRAVINVDDADEDVFWYIRCGWTCRSRRCLQGPSSSCATSCLTR